MHKKNHSSQQLLHKSESHCQIGKLEHRMKNIKKSQPELFNKFQQLHKDGQKWKIKKQKVRQIEHEKREIRQLQNCTFQPQTNDNKKFFLPEGSFLKRGREWSNSINKKLIGQREQKQKKQKQSYSFKPELSSQFNLNYSINTKSSKNITNYQMPTQKLTNSSSTSRTQYQEQKSYRNIHADQKKFKELVTMTTKPFQHLRLQKNRNKQGIKGTDSSFVNYYRYKPHKSKDQKKKGTQNNPENQSVAFTANVLDLESYIKPK